MDNAKACRWNRFCHTFYVTLGTPLVFFIGQSFPEAGWSWMVVITITWIFTSTATFLLLDWLQGGRGD